MRKRVQQRTGAPPPEAGEGAKEASESGAVRSRVEARLREARNAIATERERVAAFPEESRPVEVPEQPAAAKPEPVPLVTRAAPEKPLPPARAPRFVTAVATCVGIGRIPLAPGTFGSLAGLGAFALTSSLPAGWQLGLLGFFVLLGWWAASRYVRATGRKDPGEVVVDEFCGMWLALVFASPGWVAAAGAFLLFRLLDIVKPPPIRQLERLPGGLGVMADDLMAGLVVRILVLFFLAM